MLRKRASTSVVLHGWETRLIGREVSILDCLYGISRSLRRFADTKTG
jgi:hypothetical protein